MAGIDDVRRFLGRQDGLARGAGASVDQIRELASEWGAELPDDYVCFLAEFGWATFGSAELPGLGEAVPAHLSVLVLAQDQWNLGLPRDLLPVFESNGDWLYCLSELHGGRIVLWSHEYGEEQPYEEQYDGWSDWFVDQFAHPEEDA